MKIKEFTIGAARTINLGNYESMRIEALVTGIKEDNESWEASKNLVQLELRKLLEETYLAQKRDKK